jgi:hypothetical protein
MTPGVAFGPHATSAPAAFGPHVLGALAAFGPHVLGTLAACALSVRRCGICVARDCA